MMVTPQLKYMHYSGQTYSDASNIPYIFHILFEDYPEINSCPTNFWINRSRFKCI